MKIVTILGADFMETVEIPVLFLQDALDAMEFTFSPYLNNYQLEDYPWILELIDSFNSIASLLPEPIRSQYPEVVF